MDDPKCKLCGKRHRLGACPKFMVKKAKEPPKQFKTPELEQLRVIADKPKYDRNQAHRDYMKKYMKLKRASDRLKKKSASQ